MPVLENPRYEAFSQWRAKGKTVDEAYILAGFKANRGNAARLNANESVKKRLVEIKSRVAEKAEWSAAERLNALKRISDAAEEKDPRVAVSAIAEANKMQGAHAPAKHQHSGPNGGPIQTVDLSNLSNDDLTRLEAIFGPLAGSSGDDDEGDTSGEG